MSRVLITPELFQRILNDLDTVSVCLMMPLVASKKMPELSQDSKMTILETTIEEIVKFVDDEVKAIHQKGERDYKERYPDKEPEDKAKEHDEGDSNVQ